MSKMKGWKSVRKGEWGGIRHEILNAAASADGLANGSSLKRPAAPRTWQGRWRLGARGLGLEPGRGISPYDKSITLFLKFLLIAKVSKSYCYSQFYKILS